MSGERPRAILKASPNCFLVQELVGEPAKAIPLLESTSIRDWEGYPVTLFHLTKRGVTTEQAVREVARQLKVPTSDVSYHGIKDRHAHTAQAIGVSGEFEPHFRHDQIHLRQVGGRKYRLTSSEHAGNRFTIFVISEARSINLEALRRVPNFFGQQRLGEPGSELIGKLLLEGNYETAGELICGTPGNREISRIRARTSSWREAILDPTFRFSFHFWVLRWQSFLWNQLLTEKLEGDLPDWLSMWSPEERDRNEYRHLWDPDLINLDQEALGQIHRFSRPTVIEPTNVSADRSLIGWKIRFDLPPGAYATVALSRVFTLEEKHAKRH